MEIIREKKQIDAWIERAQILQHFDTKDLKFHGYLFEKGEYITVPHEKLDSLLFLVEGTIQIYGIRDDGRLSPINQMQSPCLIGDVEFSNQGFSPFFTQAKTPVTCLALSTTEYREALDSDLRFLHMLLRSYAKKLEFFNSLDAVVTTLEEKVLLYMKQSVPSQELNGIESTLLQLRCSRRQLQRVLKQLCEKGKIEKIGKGRYRLRKRAE